ncbi:hypothetical protein SEML1_0565 [Candidatus Southlakia epibionticum]|uniref:Uncharacterized protein n=1 Tax=Candidatus Southlakia epibionticum TaxID=3043284 RepID=A0ABY8WV93_9BACT|nr:hypothetical protein SEML1_0565 [Candidatus Saccharimonadaceae bacterium ML1]
MLLRLKVPKESCVVLEKSAFTLFYTPSHETLHVDSERLSCGNYQPMMPSIQEMTEELHALLLQREPLVVANCLGRADMMLSGALIQFSDHSGITSNDLEIIPDFSSIARLKDVFVACSARDGCLNAVQQFDEALQLAGDDIGRALMLLWAASRQYARWLDSNMLLNELTTKNDRLHEMQEWRRTLRAYKTIDRGPQDPAGDTYYMWTHALAHYAWCEMAAGDSLFNNAAAKIFWHGTEMMHGIVHRLNRQSVDSDHRIAACYGNYFGEAIVAHVQAGV